MDQKHNKSVYQIIDKNTQEVCYIGQGDIKIRMQRHMKRIRELENFTKSYLYLAFIGS